MSLATLTCRAQIGIHAPKVTIEVHVSNGLPGLSIVGLAETSVKESKDRVRSALLNAGFILPPRRITIALAPADLRKSGGRYDLAIAIGILIATDQLSVDQLEQYEFIGELALSGALRGVTGILPASVAAQQANHQLFVATENAAEASLVKDSAVLPAPHLLDVCAHLSKQQPISPCTKPNTSSEPHYSLDMQEVSGQHHAKRALEIAAAGQHNLLMVGPPGTGKTMLASRLPTILPPMTCDEALEVASIYSISPQQTKLNWEQRPFRTPHHTSSGVALVGGGSKPRPGEISLAHKGVLFIDELPELARNTLEVLREPLESGKISIARAAEQVTFPADFMLISAMNPCPCGFLGDASQACQCTPEQIKRYRSRLSGPILDRIDLHIEVPKMPFAQLRDHHPDATENSASIRQRVIDCRKAQLARHPCVNSQLNQRQIQQHCALDSHSYDLLERVCTKFNLSPRAYHKILKVARTIADLANASNIESPHISEAISFRRLDRALD